MKKGSKVKVRLDARRHAYHQTISGRGTYTGYKCPGSNKK
jgi:hypothetical protein